MQLAIYTDIFTELSYTEMLDKVKSLGIDAVEMSAGGWGEMKHCNTAELLENPEKLAMFKEELDKREMRISALNTSCNPLASTREGKIDKKSMYDCAVLAGKLGVKKITAMAGFPVEDKKDSMTKRTSAASWPVFASSAYNRQWEVTITFWKEYVKHCKTCGVEQIAIEIIPGTMVWSVETLLKLRDATDPMLGINLDPSHLIVMGDDPLRALRLLKDCIFHIHGKDARIKEETAGMGGLLGGMNDPDDIWKFVAIGCGKDIQWWKEFFGGLNRLGYNGDVSLDMTDLKAEETTEKDIIYSIETLKKVI